jgi:hypothetical protein
MQAQWEKLRVRVVECELIRDWTTDPAERDLFGRQAERFKVLAVEIEKAMRSTDPVFGKTQGLPHKNDNL